MSVKYAYTHLERCPLCRHYYCDDGGWRCELQALKVAEDEGKPLDQPRYDAAMKAMRAQTLSIVRGHS